MAHPFSRVSRVSRAPLPLRAGLAALLQAGLAVFCAACGAKGPPHPPPAKLPEPARALEVRQEGSDIVVSFRPPDRMQSGEPLQPPVRFEALAVIAGRVTTPAAAAAAVGAPPASGSAIPAAMPPGGVGSTGSTVASSAEQSRIARAALRFGRPVKTVPYEPPAEPSTKPSPEPSKAPSGSPQRVEMRLGAADLPGVRLESARLTIGVAVVDGRGRRTPPAQAQTIEPVPPLPAPSSLAVAMTARGAHLSWTPPQSDAVVSPAEPGAADTAAPATPGTAWLQAIYRWPAGEREADRPLRTLPYDAAEWLDEATPPAKRMVYAVRTSAGVTPPRRESLPAGPVEVDTHDVFAPSPPRELVAVAQDDLVRLFWFPPEESDVAGYRIYRGDGIVGEDGPFRLLAEVPAEQTSFEDRAVTPGAAYTWRVSAVDSAEARNESAASMPVTATAGETAPEETPGLTPEEGDATIDEGDATVEPAGDADATPRQGTAND